MISALSVLQKAMLNQVWDDRAAYLRAQSELWASVRAARDNGITWEELGELFGVTRSAVQQRFSKPVPGQMFQEPALPGRLATSRPRRAVKEG